ncbi:sigma-70 family RNA polymerase sigma factor [Microbacterium sp. PAMC21962]|nr:sigma-70 family RNA polymerase sigma factor [Microbacterium sp. PAMC21962]QYF96924.1 sigma-70 family RNA polymerase sigma factor [Microbacterium sp. PAMC21962]
MTLPEGEEAATLARLNVRAAQGENDAAAEYLRHVLPFLRATAVKIVLPPLDADELLSEALVRLLHKWNDGTGPDQLAHAYVIRTIRNLVVDELRSPRSRNVPLPEDDLFVDDDAVRSLRDAELASESALIREALAELPRDQQRVLLDVVVGGRKPRELTTELGRNAPAISNLLKRAKANLSRQALIQSLRSGQEDCRRNAREIPRVPSADWRDHDVRDAGMRHVEGCRTCQGNWARWATIPTALGVGAGLVVALTDRPSGASAVEERPEEASPEHRSGPRRAPSPPRARSILAVAGVTLGLAGVLVVTAGVFGATGAGEVKPEGRLDVRPISATQLSIDFDVSAASWQVDSVEILVTGGTVEAVPSGWDCRYVTSTLECRPGSGPIDATITIRPNPDTSVTVYHLEVDGRSGSYALHGVADGVLPRS